MDPELLSLDDLPADARARTVGFVCRRVTHSPGPLRLGIVALTVGVGLASRAWGEERTTGFVARTELPLVGELARLIRSLAFAYVWETWPDSSPTGAPVAARFSAASELPTIERVARNGTPIAPASSRWEMVSMVQFSISKSPASSAQRVIGLGPGVG